MPKSFRQAPIKCTIATVINTRQYYIYNVGLIVNYTHLNVCYKLLSIYTFQTIQSSGTNIAENKQRALFIIYFCLSLFFRITRNLYLPFLFYILEYNQINFSYN